MAMLEGGNGYELARDAGEVEDGRIGRPRVISLGGGRRESPSLVRSEGEGEGDRKGEEGGEDNAKVRKMMEVEMGKEVRSGREKRRTKNDSGGFFAFDSGLEVHCFTCCNTIDHT